MGILRILIVALLAAYAVPASAQQWDRVNGSMQVRSGPTAPLVIIDQTVAGQKILSLRANGVEVCSATSASFTCTGGFTFPTSCSGTYTGPVTNGVTSTGWCVNGTATVTSTSSAVTSGVSLVMDNAATFMGWSDIKWQRPGANRMLLTTGATDYFDVNGANGTAVLNTALTFGWADVSLSRVGDGILRASGSLGGFTRLILGTNDGNGTALRHSSLSLDFVNGDASGWRTVKAGSYGSEITTGTLVTNDVQTVANAGIVPLGTASVGGLLTVYNSSTGDVCLFNLRGGNPTQEVSDPSATCSITAGTATSTNVYWSAGNARYELQNNQGGARNFVLTRNGL